MDALRIGDSVRSGEDAFSKVYSFLHFDANQETIFRQIQLDSLQIPLELTHSHLLYRSNGITVRATDVQVGDEIIVAGKEKAVVKNIDEVRRRGLYAPATYSGQIVVSGITVSNYVAVLDNLPITTQEKGCHAFMAFRRIMCNWNFELCKYETYTEDGISDSVAAAKVLASMVNEQPLFIQGGAILVGFPILVILSVLEQLLNLLRPLFSVAVAAVVLFMVVVFRNNFQKQKDKAKTL